MAPFIPLSLLFLFLHYPLLSLSTNPEGMPYCFIFLWMLNLVSQELMAAGELNVQSFSYG